LRKLLVPFVTNSYICAFYLFLPVMPILASIVFFRSRFTLQYVHTLKKLVVHIEALGEGPLQHYFSNVAGRVREVPVEIEGSCVQCGNCCMNRRCVFLEQLADDKYQCGIYHSPFRRFSNCGSFPLNQRDIDRYACPSYFVARPQPVALQPIVFFRQGAS